MHGSSAPIKNIDRPYLLCYAATYDYSSGPTVSASRVRPQLAERIFTLSKSSMAGDMYTKTLTNGLFITKQRRD